MVSESNYNVFGVLNVVIKISMASHINSHRQINIFPKLTKNHNKPTKIRTPKLSLEIFFITPPRQKIIDFQTRDELLNWLALPKSLIRPPS